MILRNLSIVVMLLCCEQISEVNSKSLENGLKSEKLLIGFKDLDEKKDQNTAAEESVEHFIYENTSNSTDALEGRKKGGGGNVIIVDDDNGGHGGYEYIYTGGGKKRGKGKRKKNKGGKIIRKKVMPALYGVGAMKLLMMHFLIKKALLLGISSHFLSKLAFLVAIFVAAKQHMSQQPTHERAEGHKLEVVHVPIRKYHGQNSKERDNYYDAESKHVPVTYNPPEGSFDNTTPVTFFDLPYQSNFFSDHLPPSESSIDTNNYYDFNAQNNFKNFERGPFV